MEGGGIGGRGAGGGWEWAPKRIHPLHLASLPEVRIGKAHQHDSRTESDEINYVPNSR